MLHVQNISASYGKTQVLHNIAFESPNAGTIVALIGPNGSGKSTLFKCMAGIKKPATGNIVLEQSDIAKLDKAKLTRKVCYMPQNTYTNAALTVFEVILMARRFVTRGRGKAIREDAELISKLLCLLQIDHLSDRYLSDLSGGQRQLATLAQAVIRKPEYLLLDEPTSALDLHYQIESLDLITQVTRKFNITTFIALHDLSLAGRYADYAMVMHEGRLRGFGAAKEVINQAMIEQTYRVKAEIVQSEYGLYVLPHQSLNSQLQSLQHLAEYLS